MADVKITDLPVAGALAGDELIETVQPGNAVSGVSKRTTVGDIATFPQSGSPFVTASSTAGLSGARLLAGQSGVVTIDDAGAGNSITVGIATAGISYGRFQQVPGLSVLGVAGNSTAVIAPITGNAASQVLQVNAGATGLAFGLIGTASFSGTLTVPFGGTGDTSLTAHGVLLGNGTAAIVITTPGTAGQLLTGQTSTSDPVFVTMGGDLSLTAAGTATIATAAVTYAKIQIVTGLSVPGIAGTATGILGTITGTANQVLRVNPAGTSLGFGQVNLSSTSAITGTLGAANGGTGFSTGAREVLAADRTYYFRTDGSNTNNGLTNTSTGAFLTAQKGFDIVLGSLDRSTYTATIQCGNATGTFTGGTVVLGAGVGSGVILFQGDTATPSNIILQTTTSSTVLFFDKAAQVSIGGFKLTSSGGGALINVQGYSKVIKTGKMDFGSTTGPHIAVGGSVYQDILTDYTISGGGSLHWFGTNNAVFVGPTGRTVTLSGTPGFTTAFAFLQLCSSANFSGNTFSGSASTATVRYSVNSNSALNTGAAGTAYLPGGTNGTTSSGGQYL